MINASDPRWFVASDDRVVWHRIPHVHLDPSVYRDTRLYACCDASDFIPDPRVHARRWRYVESRGTARVNCLACLECRHPRPCEGT